MKDEIKEILDKMPKSITKILSIPSKDAKILLDYITNLQEENKRLKKDNLLLIDYQDMEQKYDDYKSRNEKTIEYIRSLCYIESKNEWFTYGDDLSPEHIVNILQGSDKDE